MPSIIPVILAGGHGSRLWPLSRSAYPKQFLSLGLDDHSMLQRTILRSHAAVDIAVPIIVCNENHRFIVAEQLRQIDINPQAIILEKHGRNTAPAIALAAAFVKQQQPEAILWVMPADHIIQQPDALISAIHTIIPQLSAGSLATFGVPATQAETAYGYIKVATQAHANGSYDIEQFVEKPDHDTAKAYVASGDYYWNCGIFAFSAQQYLHTLEQFEPDMAICCQQAMHHAHIDQDFIRPDEEVLQTCPENSIDYAVMEKASQRLMVVLNSPWNDVGSWDALMAEHSPDADGNVCSGDVITHDVSNSLLQTNRGLLAAIGVSDHIVVVTGDVVLVAHKDRCQEVKTLVSRLKQQQRDEVNFHLKVHRPWGSYQTLANSEQFKVKKIIVNAGAKLSLQSHQHRSEHWVVVKGTADIINGEQHLQLRANQSTFIPVGAKHRLANTAATPLEIIEVQVGSYLGEDDIERYDDIYGR